MTQGRNREDVAIAMLRSPETFPSLPPRREFDRLLCLWRLPSFSPYASWSLFRQSKTDHHIVRRLMHDPSRGLPTSIDDPHIYGAEGRLADADAQAVLDGFESLLVPVFRRFPGVGLDGVLYGVRTGNCYAGACLEWWEDGAEGWAPLRAMFDRAIETFERVLPAASLR